MTISLKQVRRYRKGLTYLKNRETTNQKHTDSQKPKRREHKHSTKALSPNLWRHSFYFALVFTGSVLKKKKKNQPKSNITKYLVHLKF